MLISGPTSSLTKCPEEHNEHNARNPLRPGLKKSAASTFMHVEFYPSGNPVGILYEAQTTIEACMEKS